MWNGRPSLRQASGGCRPKQTWRTVTTLHADFWQPNWATYAALDGGKAGGIGRTLLNDYLMEDIVDVDITLTYRDADGALQSLTLPDEATINWTDQGFSGASIDDSQYTALADGGLNFASAGRSQIVRT